MLITVDLVFTTASSAANDWTTTLGAAVKQPLYDLWGSLREGISCCTTLLPPAMGILRGREPVTPTKFILPCHHIPTYPFRLVCIKLSHDIIFARSLDLVYGDTVFKVCLANPRLAALGCRNTQEIDENHLRRPSLRIVQGVEYMWNEAVLSVSTEIGDAMRKRTDRVLSGQPALSLYNDWMSLLPAVDKKIREYETPKAVDVIDSAHFGLK
ncbi:hypothetical protein EDD85DRAFT_785147 [Armillaria nabsnona]|nr:hypothetical protein EDD85DRAFT_785147 [Armillaria nabsnona]